MPLIIHKLPNRDKVIVIGGGTMELGKDEEYYYPPGVTEPIIRKKVKEKAQATTEATAEEPEPEVAPTPKTKKVSVKK